MNISVLILSTVFLLSPAGTSLDRVANTPADSAQPLLAQIEMKKKSKSRKVEAGEYVNFAETGVSLQCPTGFEKSGAFYGFTHDGTASSLMVMNIPEPLDKALSRFSPEAVKPRGMVLEETSEIEFDGTPAVLHKALFTSHEGNKFNKWIAVFGDQQSSKAVIATYPVDAEEDLVKELHEKFLATKWELKPADDGGTSKDNAKAADKG